jgi:NIMA (never in mitosis gene a)-related kinase
MKAFECDGVTWQPVKVLGKGSFGEAVLVQDASEKSRLAVCKRVNLSALKPEEQKDAHNEVKVLSRLHHPNIVEFVGSCQLDGQLCILMEYCNAGDVEALIKKQKGVHLDENMLADLFVQMCHAVRYLHERRILHRDLKAQNVFLTQHMSTSGSGSPARLIVKLGDFGISTVLRNTLALAKTICGTPYYFSPELCLNRPYNNKSDIWSLGCILYEMCTLKHAFDAQNMKALMQRILTGKYAPVPQQYHPSLQVVIDGMLAQKVDKRFNIQQVMGSVFFQQHSERIIVAHETRREFHQAQQAKKSIPGTAQPPNVVISGGAPLQPKPSQNDLRAKQVEARRKEQEMKELEKKIQLEEQRRRKNIRHAQNYDKNREERLIAKHEELERLDDVRRRMEIMSYEDQQKYVEKGWRVVQEVQLAQEERKKQLSDNDRHLQSLLEQMNAMDAKMQSRREKRQPPPAPPPELPRPPLPAGPAREPSARELAQAYKNRVSQEAPWNRNREVPVGFTRETWEAHKQVMNRNEAPSTPQRGRAAPSSVQALEPQAQPLPLGHLSDNDVSMMLREERQHLEKDPKFIRRLEEEEERRRAAAAQSEWERHKAKIREAEALQTRSPTAGAPGGLQEVHEAEQLWLAQKAKVDAARAAAAPVRSPPLRPVAPTTEPAPPVTTALLAPAPAVLEQAVPSPNRFNEKICSDDSEYYSDDYESEDGFDDVVQAMKYGEQQLPPPDLFEEAPLPVDDVGRISNTIKFTLDGKTLHLPNSSADDPLHLRCAALQQFLTEALGGQRSATKLREALLNIQSADVDDSLADAMLSKLEQQYGKKSCFVDLMVQLMVCEAMLQ